MDQPYSNNKNIIQKIYRVGDAHHPRGSHKRIQKRVSQKFNLHTRHNQNRNPQKLTNQFDCRAQGAPIIPDAQKRHPRRAEQNPNHLIYIERIAEQKERGEKRNINGDAAQ